MIKKVLMVIPTNTAGGAERVLVQLADKFVEKNIEVMFVNFDSTSNFYSINKKVKYIKLNLPFKAKKKLIKILEAPYVEVKRYIKIRRIIREFNPDIVIPFLEMAEILTIPNCVSLNIPFCVSIRNDYSKYFNYMKIFSKLFYKKASLVVCQTEEVKRSITNIIKCNATVIPNPLDETTYCNEISTDKRNIIINVGRLTSQKNQTLLIKAFSKVANEIDDIELYIYGKGILKNQLQLLIDELGLSDKVFLKGTIINAIKENNDAKLFVMSSDYEGFPNTLVEAMANGIPVISTDFNTGAARELLKYGECGWLTEVGDIDKLALVIKEAILNEDIANKKAINGLYVREMLDANKIANEWLTKLKEVI